MNTNRLKARLMEYNISLDVVAQKLGITRSSLYRKLRIGGEAFTVEEANAIADLLHLDGEDAVRIFFSR